MNDIPALAVMLLTVANLTAGFLWGRIWQRDFAKGRNARAEKAEALVEVTEAVVTTWRERALEAERERDETRKALVGEVAFHRAEVASRIERETIERCIALIAGMFTRAPEVVAEIEARIRAMGDKP